MISACAVSASAQIGGDYQPAAGLSKQMQLAIHLYEEGRDTDAMDRFMDVLVHGEPAERPMANEYLNLITKHQQSSGAGFLKPRVPSPQTGAVAAPVNEPLQVPTLQPPGGRAPRSNKPAIEAQPVPSRSVPLSAPGRVREVSGTSERAGRARKMPSEAMRQDVSGIIAVKTRAFLNDLQRMEDIRIIMSDERNPRAIGIPAGLLFDRGIVFKKDAAEVLRPLTGLIYSLGATQVAILPEGAVTGDSRILDMRRTMGVSAYLYSAGVAPPRIRVNLLASQVDLPRGLADFRGIIVLFVYDQPLRLVSEGGVGEESGPPISLGVFPKGLRTDRNEGVIVEFSVSEPPAGLSSWKFQLLKPNARPGGASETIQEIVGGAPVFDQIYWNGRKGYFGKPLTPGRYEILLTAEDSKGKVRSMHEWIGVAGAKETSPMVASAPGAAVQHSRVPETAAARKTAPAKAKPVALAAAEKAVELQKKASKDSSAENVSEESETTAETEPSTPPKGAPSVALKPDVSGSPAPPAGAAASADAVECNGAVTWHVAFTRDHQTVTQEGERSLAQVADAIGIYPLDKVNLTGYASANEADPESLAKSRAERVSKALSDEYQVASGRINVHSKVTDQDRHEVEICILSGKD